MLQTIKDSLKETHLVDTIDLYKENFNPVLYFDEKVKRRDLQFDKETEDYRNKILWANHLIFIYPIWWSGMPAILKGFIDRVFAKGFAYSYKGIIPVGHLKNKTAWIITTHDTPKIYARLFQQDYGKVLKKQILNMCGIKPVKHYSMPFLRNKNKKQRKEFLDYLNKKSRNLN